MAATTTHVPTARLPRPSLRRLQRLTPPRCIERARRVRTSCTFKFAPSVVSSTTAFVATYAIETLKTRLQAGAPVFVGHPLNGIRAGIVFSAIGACIYFAIYSHLIVLWGQEQVVMASVMASLFASVARVPGRAIVRPIQSSRFEHWTHVVAAVYASGGVLAFYRGLFPYLMDEVPEAATRFFLYNFFSAFLNHTTLVGILTGLVTAMITQPFDAMQTRIMCGINNNDNNEGCLFKNFHIKAFTEVVESTAFFYSYNILKNLLP